MLEVEHPQQEDLCSVTCFLEWLHCGNMPLKGGVDL
jgi:hypothetical protein